MPELCASNSYTNNVQPPTRVNAHTQDDFLNYVLLESLEDVSNGEVFFNVDKPDQLAY